MISRTQCGGGVDFPAGTRFAACPFCASSLYLDGSRSILHYVAEHLFLTGEIQQADVVRDLEYTLELTNPRVVVIAL